MVGGACLPVKLGLFEYNKRSVIGTIKLPVTA